MRVLFATNHTYPPQRAGGSESMTHDLCLCLPSRGMTVAVLSWIAASGMSILGLTNRIKRKLRPETQYPLDRAMGYPVFRGWTPTKGIPEVVKTFRPTVAVVQAGDP